MTQDAPARGSFRDPAGFVFERDGTLFRQVNQVYSDDYDLLISSGLYEQLAGDGLLVSHEEADVEPAAPDAYKVLRPRRVPFISYPYEWSFGQLKAAALATLDIQSIALDHGMSLRDASAYNIQFDGSSPLMIDSLSFEKLKEGVPWIAYRQFCQHFLAPLALMSAVDVRLGQLSRIHLDGVPLDLAAELLPGRTRMRPGLMMHVHAHSRSQRKRADKPARREEVEGRFSMRAFRGLIDSLASTVRSLEWEPDRSEWSAYYAEAEHYTDEALEYKKKLVGLYVDEIKPSMVWDLGANVGVFSRIAAERGAFVVSLDADISSVELNYQEVRERGDANILPMIVDLTNPSPAIGWGNEERSSLAERGPADLGLALALMHHIVIGNNVPFPLFAEVLGRLCRHLVIEFVPKDDPKVQVLLASREDIFDWYTPESFESAFGQHFSVEAKEDVTGSGRILYLMTRR